MKYFLDTEFLEGTQKTWFSRSKPTIDLISIGIVAEDGREYYTISKDFNLKEAWNRYELKDLTPHQKYHQLTADKVYWIRENVLKPIFNEWKMEMNGKIVRLGLPLPLNKMEFNYKNFKYCISQIGKSNKQIAKEIKDFVYQGSECSNDITKWGKEIKPEFYGYYSDYDWVVFCWLFGKMIDLPNGFPMYCIDLKQELESKISLMKKYKVTSTLKLEVVDFLSGKNITFREAEKIDWDKYIKEHKNYPKQTNEHNALVDAKWNKELYNFLKSL
jgi:hypothetical protein